MERKNPRATTHEPNQNQTEPIGTERPAALVTKGGQGRRQETKNSRATTLEPSQNQTEPIGTERPAA